MYSCFWFFEDWIPFFNLKKRNGMINWLYNQMIKSVIKMAIIISKFRNEIMKSSFLPKYEPKTVQCGTVQGRNPSKFGLYFGENDDFMNSF